MEILRIPSAGMASNCWLLWEKESGKAAVIDPSSECGAICDVLRARSAILAWILLTHAHADHMSALDALRDATGAPAAVHAGDADALQDPLRNVSAYIFHRNQIFRSAQRVLQDGDTVQIGRESLRVMHTPGHTPGSVCYFAEHAIFTGDTLFDGSIGRTDLPGGDAAAMTQSLRKFAAVCGEYTLYPGHGVVTALSVQKKYNPYLCKGDKNGQYETC